MSAQTPRQRAATMTKLARQHAGSPLAEPLLEAAKIIEGLSGWLLQDQHIEPAQALFIEQILDPNYCR